MSGAFELLAATALWVSAIRSIAGYGLMVLTTIVTLANVHMYQQSEVLQVMD